MTIDGLKLLKEFLRHIELDKHLEAFKTEHLTRAADLYHLSEADLDAVGITDEAERHIILETVGAFTEQQLTEDTFSAWISEFGLDEVRELLQSRHCCSLHDVSQLDCSSLHDELTAFPLAIRLRLHRAVREARYRLRPECVEETEEEVVACGYWGRIPTLRQAHSDFLCLSAELQHPSDPCKSCDIEFLVDSGSEVVTVTPTIMQQLSLPLIGHVTSRGIHAAVSNVALHRAKLHVGSCAMHIEVMCLNYNSLSVQVLRRFRHVITSDRHLWLQSADCLGEDAATTASAPTVNAAEPAGNNSRL